MSNRLNYFGEFFGTFILVFVGCSAVVGAVMLGTLTSLLEVAIVWGVGVTLAIFLTQAYSHSHLNPAVSLAMVAQKHISLKEGGMFVVFQFLGAFIAALCVFALFEDVIILFESQKGIVRGTEASKLSAMVFGEFFPNPANANKFEMSWFKAFVIEAIGTGILVLTILMLSSNRRLSEGFKPILIGGTVSMLIVMIAPFTQAGLNPARDLAPRLFSAMAGWGDTAFTAHKWESIVVYVFGPLLGALIASKSFNVLKNKFV